VTAGLPGDTTMYRGHTAGVVVPAYNEEKFVADTVASVPDFVDRVYVVDDGSTDGTWREIQDRAAVENARRESPRYDRVVVPIQHPENRGVGGAIKTGYLRAREDRVEVTAVMGGDGQMEPEMLGDLVDPIVEGRAEYTKGNRFLTASDRGDMPAFRFVGNAILAMLTKVASGYWGSGDPQSGYTAIALRALDEADIEGMYEFYGYCNDLLVKLNLADMRVADVARPITYGEEESGIDYKTYIPRVSWMLLRNFLKRLTRKYVVFDFHPLSVAYLVGAVAFLSSLAGFVWSVPGVGSTGTPALRFVLSGFALLVGAGFLVAAMSMDRAANAHLDATPERVVGPMTRVQPADAPSDDTANTDEPEESADATEAAVCVAGDGGRNGDVDG